MTHSDLPATPWRWLVPLIVVGVAWVVTPVLADDWPQWRGAGRLGVWHETGIVDALPDALAVTWRVPIGSGFSGPRGGRRARLRHRLGGGSGVAHDGRDRARPGA